MYFAEFSAAVGGVMLGFHTPNINSNGEDFIFIDLAPTNIKIADHDSDRWAELDTAIASVRQHPRYLFGFDDREHILRFASTVVNGKLASLSTGGEVRYVMAQVVQEVFPITCWHRATIESEELEGTSATHLSFQVCADESNTVEGEFTFSPYEVYS